MRFPFSARSGFKAQGGSKWHLFSFFFLYRFLMLLWVSFGLPLGAFWVPKLAQVRSRNASRRCSKAYHLQKRSFRCRTTFPTTKTISRRPRRCSKGPKMGPRWLQDGLGGRFFRLRFRLRFWNDFGPVLAPKMAPFGHPFCSQNRSKK